MYQYINTCQLSCLVFLHYFVPADGETLHGPLWFMKVLTLCSHLSVRLDELSASLLRSLPNLKALEQYEAMKAREKEQVGLVLCY